MKPATETIRARRRIYVSVDPSEARKGDVARVYDHGVRTLVVLDRRGGRNAGLKVQVWNAEPRWVPMAKVLAVFRWHREVDTGGE